MTGQRKTKTCEIKNCRREVNGGDTMCDKCCDDLDAELGKEFVRQARRYELAKMFVQHLWIMAEHESKADSALSSVEMADALLDELDKPKEPKNG